MIFPTSEILIISQTNSDGIILYLYIYIYIYIMSGGPISSGIGILGRSHHQALEACQRGDISLEPISYTRSWEWYMHGHVASKLNCRYIINLLGSMKARAVDTPDDVEDDNSSDEDSGVDPDFPGRV